MRLRDEYDGLLRLVALLGGERDRDMSKGVKDLARRFPRLDGVDCLLIRGASRRGGVRDLLEEHRRRRGPGESSLGLFPRFGEGEGDLEYDLDDPVYDE